MAKAAKGALLDLTRRRQPGVRNLVTQNANSDGAMLAINRRLGFAVDREEVTYQFTAKALPLSLR